MPRVSVILTTYNDSRYIEQALRSVINQSWQDWETVLINDGSTDDTDAVIRRLLITEPRMRYYVRQHRGIVPCVREGLSLAQGEYIARLGADDAWSDSNKLTQQVNFLDARPDYALVGAWAEAVSATGQSLYRMAPAVRDAVIRRKLLIRNQFIDSSVLYRKVQAEQVGGYRQEDWQNEDYSLALRLARSHRVYNFPKVMAHYRINPRGVTQTKARQRIVTALRLVKENRRYYPNFWLAWLQWRAQYLIVALGGVAVLNLLKRLYYNLLKHAE